MIKRAEPGTPYYFVELTAGPAIVLTDQERGPLRSSFSAARLESGNYFHSFEAAQRFANSVNQILRDYSDGLGYLNT